ncbi:MAG: acetyl-coenzyme A synthetase N-terminal domain-containing protein, partial [Desulfobulbaceae bacterium]|nr:acetyl-coenzyme A synthetase N-terminal domain-containing protein [Desulfobulbaceae bacterium]
MSTEKNIESLSTEKRVFNPPEEGKQDACIKSMAEYEAHYKRSMDDPDGYWADRASELLTWDKPWDQVIDADLYKPEVKWFVGGKLNVSTNCLDRHLTNGRRNKAAIIWQGEPEEDVKVYTYQ